MFNKFYLLLSILLIPGVSYAYLDPGSGSIIFQALIAGAMGTLYFVKVFWSNIKLYIVNAYRKVGGNGKRN